METMEAIKGRRSIRQYKTTPVDDKTVELVLEAARWAPSWANRQCWRFVVVRDSKIKAELAGTTYSQTNQARESLKNAPVVIVACGELGKAGFSRDTGQPSTDKGEYWYMFDVGLATQNLVLEAYSLGLGTVIVGSFDAKTVAAILGVAEGFCVVAMTPLGYPDQDPGPRPRKELAEIVYHDKFGG
ncbi:MAG: nitroreductase family protein [Chloroflexi bacterium]|nr:nitroreductase family protein [Chloroflexota bacterium]MBI2980188.1 nitroreductase family protein [Chloroflexota bacterium]